MPDSLSTQVLIARVQKGDQDAENTLCRRYLSRALVAVRIRLGAKLRQKVRSSDIVQEVMIDIVRALPAFDFRTDGAFSKYLNRVVENRIRDQANHWGAQKRDMAKEVPLEGSRSSGAKNPLYTLADPSATTPSMIVSRQEELARLEQAMDQLGQQSEESRELIVQTKIEGRTYQEIADEDGSTPDAVRMRANRASCKLSIIYKDLELGS